MFIAHNLNALRAYNSLTKVNNNISSSIEKLSSGFRINRAADDACGLAISEKMRAQISGLSQAAENVQDSISLLEVAQGGLNEVTDALQRIRKLSLKAINDTADDSDRQKIQDEIEAMKQAINEISKNTEFNGKQILGKSEAAPSDISKITVQEGANAGQNLTIYSADVSTSALKIGQLEIITSNGRDNAIKLVDKAIDNVTEINSKFGAYQNRLEHAYNNLLKSQENLKDAESRIRDVDMAKEMMKLAKNKIIQQSAQAMLSQSMKMPQNILQLLLTKNN